MSAEKNKGIFYIEIMNDPNNKFNNNKHEQYTCVFRGNDNGIHAVAQALGKTSEKVCTTCDEELTPKALKGIPLSLLLLCVCVHVC